MEFTRLPPPRGEGLPPCEDCNYYRTTLREGASGAPAGVHDFCELAYRTPENVYATAPGCIRHTELTQGNTPGTIIDNHFPPYFNSPLSAILDEYRTQDAIEQIVGSIAFHGLGASLKRSEIVKQIEILIEVLIQPALEQLAEAVITGVDQRINDHTQEMSNYVTRAVQAHKDAEHVQDNGEVPECSDGGD